MARNPWESLSVPRSSAREPPGEPLARRQKPEIARPEASGAPRKLPERPGSFGAASRCGSAAYLRDSAPVCFEPSEAEPERKRLRQLITTAKSAPDSAPETPQLAPNAAERLEALKDLRAWYDDWSEVAHAVVKRRDQLIRLGLAQRKTKKKNKSGGDEGGEK
jgi:hypothetical protein